MAKNGLLKEEFLTRKGDEDVPVDPCKGWNDPCEFCDKRFGSWVESSSKVLEKIPNKPGIFMVALSHKGNTEVRNIVLDTTDLQRVADNCVDFTKDHVADKKSKATKSSIMCRWMNFKTNSDKDVVNLCAHWFNNGLLPGYMESWPGMDLVEESGHLAFSNKLQKWCYPRKEAVWRKAKATPTKTVEVVAECDFEEPCELCDDNFGFSRWRSFTDVIDDNLTPDSDGIYQVSVKYGKAREIVFIGYDLKNIKFNIKMDLKNSQTVIKSVLRNEKFKNRNAELEVRWLEMQNIESQNNCFMYAHWLNSDRYPVLNTKMPGERLLEKDKHFVFKVNDKKWCYELEVFKQSKLLSKYGTRKQIRDDMREEISYTYISED